MLKHPKRWPSMTIAPIKQIDESVKILRDEWESKNKLTLITSQFTNLTPEVTLNEYVHLWLFKWKCSN